MRKALVPLLASLLLCGAATGALVATNALAQPAPRNPMLLAQNTETPPASAQLWAACIGSARPTSPHSTRQGAKTNMRGRWAAWPIWKTRLGLTGSSSNLFSAWRAVKLDIAKRHADDCTQREVEPGPQRLNPVDRMARMEDLLKKRITDLDAERPAFAALYNALSPEQRKPSRRIIIAMMRRGMWGHHGMGRGMMGPGARPATPRRSPQ